MRFLIFALLVHIFFASIAIAQPVPEVPVDEAGDVARGQDTVPVPQDKSDREISSRLTKIYNITGWFQDLSVTSQDGVVTVKGKLKEASQRDWAIQLAKDTEGVIAVVNKLELVELGWFDTQPAQAEVRSFWKKALAFIPYVFVSFGILVLSILLFRFFANLNARLLGHRVSNAVLRDVVSKFAAIPIFLLGLYLVLRVLGLTGLAFTLLGGTGAIGLVAGFAFKNILENYFSGIMLSVRKPFVVGDVIEVAGQKGVVFKMTTRGTTLVDFDGHHILIPNSTVFANIIKNHTASPVVRTHLQFKLAPDVDSEVQRRQVRDFLRARPEIESEPKTEIFVNASGEERLLDVYFWINQKRVSPDKIKNVLSEQIQQGLTSPEGLTTSQVNQREALATVTDVGAILKRAKDSVKNDRHETALI